jgi:hypothetical protein
MGVTRQTRNPYEANADGGDMMAMSPGDERQRTVMGRRAPRPLHGHTMDLDTQEGVGLHTGHVDALMRGEFRAGRGRGFAEGQEDSRAEWPVAYERGWHTGASEGEEFILAQVTPALDELIADVSAARGGFKKLTDKKVSKAMLHEELTMIATRLDTMRKQHAELFEGITGS